MGKRARSWCFETCIGLLMERARTKYELIASRYLYTSPTPGGNLHTSILRDQPTPAGTLHVDRWFDDGDSAISLQASTAIKESYVFSY